MAVELNNPQTVTYDTRYLKLDGSNSPMSGAIFMNSNSIFFGPDNTYPSILAFTKNLLTIASPGSVSFSADLNLGRISDKVGFFGTTPVIQQAGGVNTAGALYTGNEQGMINTMYATLRMYGLLS